MNGRRVVVALCLATLGARAGAQIPSSVEFRVPKPPTVAVNDSSGVLGYELHVTNLTTNPMVLRRVEVVDAKTGGSSLITIADSAILGVLSRPGLAPRTSDQQTLGPGMRAVVYLWVPVDANNPPAAVRHRVTLQRGTETPETLEGTPVTVTRRAVEIGPPLRGRWVAVNGPSNSSGHRRLVLGLNGNVASGQRFAIDFLQVDDSGKSTRSDRSSNKNFYAYGSEILAVADGIVVETKDSIPENDPTSPTNRAVPITLETVGGNHIVLDIGNGYYAFYAHVQPGSLRVKVGDRVKRGQVIALLGNSGNSTEPHLHFHVSDALAAGTTTLGSEGVPYGTTFELLGRCTLTTAIKCTTSGPVIVRGGMPIQNQMVRFP